MRFFARGARRRFLGRSVRRSALSVARALDFMPRRREQAIAARRRAAQIAVIARYSPAMLAANVLNALVLAAALLQRPSCPAVFPWLGVLFVYFVPLALRIYRRRDKSPPTEAGPGAVKRATLHAAILGTIWGVAAALFFDAGRSDELLVVCIACGMLCGGAFALATLPQAVIAYTIPLAVGSLIGLLRGAREPVQYLAAPLLLSYFAVIVRASLSHGAQFSARVMAQARAEMEARHDPLTGLPNRTAFNAALQEAYRRLDRYGEKFALFYIDLDDFKCVNDRLGHQAGDQLLQQMAGRLAGNLRANDLLTRLGGDEFVILARGVGDGQSAAALANDLAKCFEAPFILEGGSADCRASIGIALAPTDGSHPSSLLSHADAALYKAKRDRTATPHLYHHGEDREVGERRTLAQEMKGALARGEFFLEFQPIMNLETSRIESNEALVRWRHPTRGLVPPAQFIPLAERSGAIHEIGEWIMFEACREARRWPEDVRIAVNVSAEQICDHSIVAIVEAALREGRLSPDRLHVEVTESAALGATQGASAAIERLHERGVAIVLDDFGTGFSSFDHIRRLPVKSLKIDRSFVCGLPSRKCWAIVQAVAHLAHALELDVTAEGIESETQLEFLKAAGVRNGQGYWLARPQSGAAIGNLVGARRVA